MRLPLPVSRSPLWSHDPGTRTSLPLSPSWPPSSLIYRLTSRPAKFKFCRLSSLVSTSWYILLSFGRRTFFFRTSIGYLTLPLLYRCSLMFHDHKIMKPVPTREMQTFFSRPPLPHEIRIRQMVIFFFFAPPRFPQKL